MRRAAGTRTRTLGDVLLRWSWVRRRSVEGDRADLEGGVTLKVAGFTKTIGAGAGGAKVGRLRAGWVLLTAGEPLVWEDRRGGRRVVLAGPLGLVGEGERVPGAFKFRSFELTTGDGAYDLAVPTADVEIVLYALGVTV